MRRAPWILVIFRLLAAPGLIALALSGLSSGVAAARPAESAPDLVHTQTQQQQQGTMSQTQRMGSMTQTQQQGGGSR